MKVGFTGTRKGMTEEQRHTTKMLLLAWFKKDGQFHHGDCLGADAEAHDLAKDIGYKIHIHPPINDGSRAFKKGTGVLYHPAKPYLDRNKQIVLCTDRLIATPKEAKEVLRSGTWSTVRFARRYDGPIYLVLPNGKLETGYLPDGS